MVQIRRNAWVAVVCLSFIAGVGCSKSTTPAAGGTTASAAVTAITDASAAVNKLATPAGGAASLAAARSAGFLSNLTDWSASNLVSDPRNSGGSCTYSSSSIQTRMQVEFTEGATRCNGSSVNVFGKIKDRLNTVCQIASVLGESDSSNLPSSGTTTITDYDAFIAQMSLCGSTSSVTASLISNLSITYQTPSDTSVYDRLLTLNMTYNGQSESNTVYIKYNSTTVNVAEGEFTGTTLGEGSDRTILSLDRTNQILKGEYISGNYSDFNGYYFHRLYWDGAADLGRVYSDIAVYSGTTAGGGTIAGQGVFVATAKPETSSQPMALGVDFSGNMNNGSYSTIGSYDLTACIDMSDGSATAASPTANTFTCAGTGTSVTGKAIDAVSTRTATRNLVNTIDWSKQVIGTQPTLSWDIDSMLTTNPS